MFLNFNQVLEKIKEDERQDKINHQKNLIAYRGRMRSLPYPDGGNIVGDHDEDYVFDTLFDIPNR